MSSPLQSVDKFNKPKWKPYELTINVPAEHVGFAITVFVMKSGAVHVHGPIKDLDSCLKGLELGIDRIKQVADERRALEEANARPTA